MSRLSISPVATLAIAATAAAAALAACSPSSTTPSPASPPTAATPSSPAPPAEKDLGPALALAPLADSMKDHFSVGAAVEPHHLNDMGEVVAHHFNRLTAENAMKMGPLCPSSNCDFTNADKVAAFAREHQMQMNGHTFVWYQMYPEWLFKDGNGEASKEVVSQRLRDHIFALTERYADVVDNWDVVNEAISDSGDKTYRDADEGSKWYGAFGGEEYVKVAFEHAAAAAEAHDPTVKLYYNDYNVVNADKRKKTLEMVRWLRKEGVRVDGVGLQAHWNLDWPTPDQIRTAIDELAAENLLVKISELDVSVYSLDDWGTKKWQAEMELTPDLEERITRRWVEIFTVLAEKSDVVEHVTLWGMDDGSTWLNGFPTQRKNYPLLFDRSYQPKPALKALLEI